MKTILFLAAIAASAFLYSCVESPSDIGFQNFGSGDTLAIITVDTRIVSDSITVTSKHGIARSTNVSSSVLLVGRRSTDHAVAEAFLKFGFPDFLDDASINSATLILTPSTYETGKTDSTRRLKYYVYNVIRNWGDNATWDSLGSPLVLESTPRDSFTIKDIDSVARLPFTSTSKVLPLIHDWCVAAGAWPSTKKNYGIALVPDRDTTTIIKAYGGQPGTSGARLEITYTKPGDSAVTQTFSLERDLYVATADSAQDADDIIVQAGVGTRSSIRFDLSKLPRLAQLNAVTFELTLKEKILGRGAQDSIAVIPGDSATDTLRSRSNFAFAMTKTDSASMLYRLTRVFLPTEHWIRYGTSNLGLLLEAGAGLDELSSMKRFVFYGPNATDPAKRPRLRLTYSYTPNK